MRFDRAAEFLAACASGDTEEAKVMLEEAKESSSRRNGEKEEAVEIINCSNADGITALHQVRENPLPAEVSVKVPADNSYFHLF